MAVAPAHAALRDAIRINEVRARLDDTDQQG